MHWRQTKVGVIDVIDELGIIDVNPKVGVIEEVGVIMTSIPKTLVATDNGDAHADHVGSWFFKGMSMLTMLVVRVKEHGVPRHGVI